MAERTAPTFSEAASRIRGIALAGEERREGVGGLLRTLSYNVPPIALFAAVIALWEGYAYVKATPYILPRVSVIVATLWQQHEPILRNLPVTLQEIGFGFLLAFTVGISLAVLISLFVVLNRALYPLIVASQTLPVIAIAPILFVWFGYGILPKVVVTALICFFPMVVNTVTGLTSVEEGTVKLMQSFPATRLQIFRKVQLPASLPYMFAGVKVSVVLSVIGAVVGEWVGADRGLGFVIVHANAHLQTPLVFASILVLSVIGIGLFVLVSGLERVLIPWHFALLKKTS